MPSTGKCCAGVLVKHWADLALAQTYSGLNVEPDDIDRSWLDVFRTKTRHQCQSPLTQYLTHCIASIRSGCSELTA